MNRPAIIAPRALRFTLSRVRKTTTNHHMKISISIPGLSAITAEGVMLLIVAGGCSQEDKDKAKANASNAIDKTSDALNTASEKVKEAAPKIKEGAEKFGEAVTNGAAKAWDATKAGAQKASETIKAKTATNTPETRSQSSATTTNDVQKE